MSLSREHTSAKAQQSPLIKLSQATLIDSHFLYMPDFLI